MTHELLVVLERTTVAASLATILVMALRVPLRRAFGCGVAYAAWLAVPLTALATMLPAPTFQPPALGVTPLAQAIVGTTAMPAVASGAGWSWQSVVALLWMAGAIGMALWQVHAQRAFVRGLGKLKIDGDVAISPSLSIGPALIGLWRPRIVVPSDFDERYGRVERELIVAHERAHATAGDPLVNLLGAALLCVWWFDPLIHIALRLLRHDQELARDTDVMRGHPGMRRTYADAMLKTQLASPSRAPLVCRWEPKHPLKERIMNLSRTPSTAARRVGCLTVTLGLLCGAYAAWAEQGSPAAKPTVTVPARSFADWTNARPSSTVKVTPGPKPGQFLISVRVTDLETSKVLAEPRILTAAGIPATMETGTDRLLVRFVVTVSPSGREAAYTNEILRDGRVESSQSAVLVIDGDGVSQTATTPSAEAKRYDGPDGGKYAFQLTFSSTDKGELSCVADVFAAAGKPDLADAMRASWDGKRKEASFKTIAATVPPEADALVASLSKCQLGVDSRLTWSVSRQAT